MFKLAVLASGRGSNLQSLIDNLHFKKDNSIEIKCVISNNKEAYALKRAQKTKITFYLIDDNMYNNRREHEQQIKKIIDSYDIDLIVLAGYMKVLTSDFVEYFKNKIINIHPSLLPAFAGLDAQRQAVDYGVKVSGCTVHFVDKGVDSGPIIKQKVVCVNQNDTEASLSKKILKEEHKLLPKVVKLIAEDKIIIKDSKVFYRE
jgi:phosphoribosylglycinamide formyltransferase-1